MSGPWDHSTGVQWVNGLWRHSSPLWGPWGDSLWRFVSNWWIVSWTLPSSSFIMQVTLYFDATKICYSNYFKNLIILRCWVDLLRLWNVMTSLTNKRWWIPLISMKCYETILTSQLTWLPYNLHSIVLCLWRHVFKENYLFYNFPIRW